MGITHKYVGLRLECQLILPNHSLIEYPQPKKIGDFIEKHLLRRVSLSTLESSFCYIRMLVQRRHSSKIARETSMIHHNETHLHNMAVAVLYCAHLGVDLWIGVMVSNAGLFQKFYKTHKLLSIVKLNQPDGFNDLFLDKEFESLENQQSITLVKNWKQPVEFHEAINEIHIIAMAIYRRNRHRPPHISVNNL